MDNQPMRKTEARVAQRERARKQAERRNTIMHTLPFVIAAVGVLALGIGVFLMTNPSATGTPRLQVTQDKIDLGNRIFDQPVRAAFTVKNIGDGTLKLETPRIAEVIEGC